jgi:glycosyltransferase 2 family protein
MFSHLRPYTKYIALFITVIFVALLLTQVSIKDVITTLSQISPIYLLVGLFLYLISYLLRTWRFYLLLNEEADIKNLFHIECVHNMLNNLLPARTGELSYIYFLKTEQNKTAGEGLSSLIIARIFDFVIITLIFLFLFLFVGNLAPGFMILVIAGIVFLIFLVILLIGLLFYGHAILDRFKPLLKFLDFKKYSLGMYITKKSEDVLACVQTYNAGKARMHMSVILYSVGIWFVSYLLFYLLAVSMNINFGIIPVLFATSFAVFSTVLPIQGIGGFGTMEGGWALGFIMVGVSNDVAISTGFGFHLIILFYTLLLGIFGYLSMFLSRKERKPDL